MLYLYDRTICNDLKQSFNPINSGDPVVTFVDTESVIGLAAQIQDDNITFPVVAVTRKTDTNVDRNRLNFTRLHSGVQSVIDNKTNNVYYERVLPVDLRYVITVLSTNVVDMDEIVREILFKYSNMYFLTLKLPYEASRKVRFGVMIDPDSSIDRSSSTSEYIKAGQLYQTLIPLKVDGAVLVSYTPAKLIRKVTDVNIVSKHGENLI